MDRLYPLPTIPYLRLRYSLEAQGPSRLSTYKGSMLRGAFGHALRSSVCLRDARQECSTCPLRESCAYARLFESRVEGEPPPFCKGQPNAPQPYVFEARDLRRDFRPGERMETDLLLFGNAVKLQGYATLAMGRMAERGLGPGRHGFRLVGASAEKAGGGWLRLPTGREGLPAALATAVVPAAETFVADRATLHLLTPTRLKIQGRIASRFDFRALVFKMARRVLELAHFHVPGPELDWHIRPLLEAANQVRITGASTRWQNWPRYSSRQRQAIHMRGLVGRLHLEGDLTPFTPLLRLAEILHVGKNTTFGLGQVAVAW